MPTAPGHKPFADERRYWVALTADSELNDALEVVGNALRTSMNSTALYCAILGVNPLMEQYDLPQLAMPAYLTSLLDREVQLPGLEQVEGEQPTVLRRLYPAGSERRKPSASRVGFLESQAFVFKELAVQLRMSGSSLATWAVVRHLNVVLASLGHDPVALPPVVVKKLPKVLLAASGLETSAEAQEPLAVPADPCSKESRLAS